MRICVKNFAQLQDEQQKVLEELYTEELEGEAETAEADAEEEKEEPIVDDVEVNAGGQ